MSKTRMFAWGATALTALAIVTLCTTVVLSALFDSNTSVEDLYDGNLHRTLVAEQVVDLQDLADRFCCDQYSFLWVAPPDPDFILTQPGGLIPLLDLNAFPDAFIDGLAGIVEKDGIRRFPILIYEDADSVGRDIVIESLEGKQIARIPREWDYTPEWFVRERYPTLDVFGEYYKAWILSLYDPARIRMRYSLLVGDEDLVKYVWAHSFVAAQPEKKVSSKQESSKAGSTITRMSSGWSGGSVTNFGFVALDGNSNGTLELTIAWPMSGLATNGVDFFACTNLLDPDWSIALTTNVDLSTNTFCWIDEDYTNYPVRFYDCWTHDDTDADGISDGRERRLYGTDEALWDTDGDGVSDGEEIDDSTDPLNEDDPPNVKGEVIYSGWQTGTVWVVAVTSSNSWSTNVAVTLTEPGTYQITKLSDTNYWLRAYIDSDEDESTDTNEACGNHASSSIMVTGQVTGVDIVLSDPDADADGLGDWWELKWFGSTNAQSGTDNPDGDTWNNEAEYLYGLNPTNSETATGDEDGDGYMNIYEIEHGTHCLRAGDYPEPTVTVTPNGALTIQQAIDQATNAYDIIMVSTGTFTRAGDKNLDFGGQTNLLISVGGSEYTVLDCSGSGRGLTFSSGETSHTVVRGITVQNGSTNNGGALYCSASSPTVQNCVFRDNTAVGNYGGGLPSYGGAIYVTGGDPWIENCSMLGNTANHGGGVYLVSFAGELHHCVIAENHATHGGGGLNIHVASGAFQGCIITDNVTYGSGGGVYCDLGSPQFENCLLRNNEAWEDGGAIASMASSHPTIISSTLIDNQAQADGHGVYVYAPTASAAIHNSIVWGDSTNQLARAFGTLSVSYSDIRGGWTGTGNIDSAPVLIPQTCRLASTSPCKNAGSSNNASAIDFEGESRPYGGYVDIGADEFVDSDSDAMADAWEQEHFGDLTKNGSSDSDVGGADGLTDLQEYQQGTDPNASDTDADGLSDYAEIYTHSTLAMVADSDGDLIPDGWEIDNALDPLNPDDGMADADRDGAGAYYEWIYGTDPSVSTSTPPASLYVDAAASPGGDGSQGNPYPSIQAALDAAEAYAVVQVADGTYTNTGDKNLDFGGKALLLMSTNGPVGCVIDCQGSGRGFLFDGGETRLSVVSGLTLRNGNTNAGAAVYCSYAGPTIQHCIIEDNTATSPGGGGFYFYRALTPLVQDCIIRRNASSAAGSGLYCDASHLILQNTAFQDNTTGDSSGTVYFWQCWQPTVRNVTIAHNTGDGIVCAYSDLVLQNSILWGNTQDSIQYFYGVAPMVSYSCVQGGWAGTGNMSTNPQLVAGSYRLKAASPCIDAASATNAPAHDQDGESRWDDPSHSNVASTWDMGCDEFVDTDTDGMADLWEEEHFGDLTHTGSADGDTGGADGLTDLEEYEAGTDPANPDTDADGITDGDEVNVTGTDPLDDDSDDDLILDGWEVDNGQNPLDAEDVMDDKDRDGVGSYYEWLYQTDPNAATSTPPATLYVDAAAVPGGDGSQGTPFDTIQAALDAAQDDDIVQLADGIYTNAADRNLVFAGKACLVRSTNGAANCVTDCLNLDRAFVFAAGEGPRSAISGITIRNGQTTSWGGAIYASASSPTFSNLIIEDNVANYGGGGVYFSGCASPRFQACLITGNTATTYGGGGIYAYNSQPRIDTSAIQGNTVAGDGGGIFCYAGADAQIRNCTIAANTAAGTGGGVYCGNYSDVTIHNSILSANITNQLFAEANSSILVTWSAVEGGWPGTGNLTADPELTRISCRLTINSPCIDAGSTTNAASPDGDNEAAWDYSGRTNVTSAVDMGSDEYVDTDEDGIPDVWESAHFGNPTNANALLDSDGDGLTNLYEYAADTDPLVDHGDTDGDTLSDDLELWIGTDPGYWDTDDDGMGDAWEWGHGFDPTSPNNPSADTDGDGWTDQEEADHGTDPNDNDTDDDGTLDGEDADPFDDTNSAVATDQNTTQMTLFVGDRSGSHSERYKIVVGPYQVYMSHVSSSDYEFSKTFRVPRGKTYEGYLESLSDDDNDGDYDADVTGGGIMVDDPWPSDSSGRVLGGHHENSGFNSGQRTFTVMIAGSTSDEESTDGTDYDSENANSIDPINTINGNVTVNDTDLVLPAPGIPLVLRRAYDSRSIYTNSPVGACWSHSYDWSLSDVTNHVYRGVSNDWKVLRTGSGDLHWFEVQTNGTFKSPAGVDYRLTDETTHYDLVVGASVTCEFSTNGLLQSIADPHGNSLSFTYTTSGGRPVVSDIDHSSGPSLEFTYSDGRLTRVDTATNTLYVTYAYNSQNELTNATRYASGETYATTYSYGDVHSLTQRVNAAGDTFDYGYEIVTNASDVVIAKGTSMTLNTNWYAHTVAYNTASNRSTLTYERDVYEAGGMATNQVYDYRYDPDTLAISAVYGPNGTNFVTRYTRDAAHNVTRIKTVDETTGEYLLSSTSYDIRHNPASVAVGYNALPLHTWNYVWNLTNDTLLSASDPLGNETTFDYNGTLPIAAYEYPAQGQTLTTSFGYTPNGQLAAVTNANGHWGRFDYGPQGYVTSAVPQVGPTVSYAYNALGHLTGITLPDASGDRTTTFVPDDMGRVTSVSYPLGSLSESFAYDKMGNLTNHADTAGRDTKFTYAPTRKLTSVTRGSGAEEATVSFAYDQQFNTLTIKDALNREVEAYTLDVQDRPVTISNVESQTMSVVYGVADMVKSVTRFDGSTVSNAYDTSARLTGVSWPDAASTFTYYDNALLRTVANEAGTVSNAYDEANRLTSVSSMFSALSVVNDYSLDGIGNSTNILISVEGSGILTNTYTFDAAERVSEIDGTSGTFAFEYGTENGLVALASNTTSGIRAEYQFDDLDRLTNIVWRNATNGVLRSFAYGYDDAGMITSIAREASAESTTYGYDSLDRLTSASASYLTASYAWDLAGNPSSRAENGTNTSYTLGTGNKLMSWTGGSYGHDSAGCVTNITRGGDTLSLSWDSRYNLSSVATNGTVAEEYVYGPMGQRVTTVVNGVTNHHVYGGAHCVADLDADGDLLRSYQPGPGVDNWLGMTVHTGATPVVYYYLTDHLGTVHAVADASGSVVESYRYDAHGKVLGVWDDSGTPLSESAIGNCTLWQGRQYSWATGLYFFRSRFYDPVTARFLSRDRLGISGGINLFQAFSANPVMFSDAFGTDPDDNYWVRSGEQILLGNFTDEVTLAGTGGQVALGLVGVDLPLDIRDIGADLINWEWSWGHAGQTGLDLVALLPVIGAVKYADEAGDLIKGSRKARLLKSLNKVGRKQVNFVAQEFGISGVRRKQFGKFIEKTKGFQHRGGADNYTYDELRTLAQEFLESGGH